MQGPAVIWAGVHWLLWSHVRGNFVVVTGSVERCPGLARSKLTIHFNLATDIRL